MGACLAQQLITHALPLQMGHIPQPTSVSPSGVHSRRLMAALCSSQVRGLQVLAGGQAVEHVHDAAVGHQCNLAAHVLRGQTVYRVLNAAAQHGQRFATAIGHKVRVALAPAQGLLGLLGLDFLEGAPSKLPKQRSRRPASGCTGQPVVWPTACAVLSARCRSLL